MMKRLALVAAAVAEISACKGRAPVEGDGAVGQEAAELAAIHGKGKGGRGSAEVVREEKSPHGEVRLYSGAVADLDSDGALELVAGGFAADEDGRRSTIRVYRQGARGGWVPWLENGWDGGKGSTARNLEIGDLDGDGQLEVVVLGRVGDRQKEARARMAIFQLTGGALKKQREVEWNEVVYTHGYGLALGDLDGDGLPEIATGGFLFDGKREQGFVRVWAMRAGQLALRTELKLGGAETPSMRVNDLAIGDVDGAAGAELVVAGRTGGLKLEGAKRSLADRREHGELVVLRLTGGAGGGDRGGGKGGASTAELAAEGSTAAETLATVGSYSWVRGTSLRLRSVVLAELDDAAGAEIVAGGQYDADGKAALGWFRFHDGKLALAGDASSEKLAGEIKDLVAVGRGAEARILATGPLGDRPQQQGNVGAWHLVKGELVSDASMVSRHGDETKSRAVVVVPGEGGSTLLTIGHARTPAAMVGQVLRWPIESGSEPGRGANASPM